MTELPRYGPDYGGDYELPELRAWRNQRGGDDGADDDLTAPRSAHLALLALQKAGFGFEHHYDGEEP